MGRRRETNGAWSWRTGEVAWTRRVASLDGLVDFLAWHRAGCHVEHCLLERLLRGGAYVLFGEAIYSTCGWGRPPE